jgi:hypothetical protein
VVETGSVNLFKGPQAGKKVGKLERGAHIPAESVCEKALKREQNPDRLAGKDGESIAGRRQLIRRSG